MITQQHTGGTGFFEMIREEMNLRVHSSNKLKAQPSHPGVAVAFPGSPD
jgi:hypothetical protein